MPLVRQMTTTMTPSGSHLTYLGARHCRCLTLLTGRLCRYEGRSPRHSGHEPTPSSAGPGLEPGADKRTPVEEKLKIQTRGIDTNQKTYINI